MSHWAPLARLARRRLLRMHFESRIGHLGGNLSALDALLVLHHRLMRPGDDFILSKGHAAGALYVTLWSLGLLSEEDLASFHGEGTRLAGHPVPGWSERIGIATGSLGHGFPVALGMALKRHLEHERGHLYCLTSDGEWQEGAMWEALIFWAHRRLPNLTVLIDVNGLQGFGSTREVASMEDLGPRLKAFGLAVVDVDGHDHEAIAAAAAAHPGALILLHTVKGKGVSFMENRMEWHYLPLSEAQYAAALGELEEPAATLHATGASA
ncbi:MAG TPA: 1-deoxy-D-xylulose-5-phosphate synthase N-terminal domain-containing protein [Steroidobacteraceae bacterium]|nr:1-deoxy-D-xylulose-5-phosphate synthase N-terminal domain-containing protein [Steroidobacteraceae bacterium]